MGKWLGDDWGTTHTSRTYQDLFLITSFRPVELSWSGPYISLVRKTVLELKFSSLYSNE